MLGKLLKHEFKETAKLLIPLNLVLVALTAIGAILLGTSVFQNDSLGMLAVSSLLIYILSIFALFIITAVYLTVRYYKTMYSNQGYLTHTLPVSSTSIINTKILVSAFWSFVALCITICSVFVLVRVTAGDALYPAWKELCEALPQEMGISVTEFILLLITYIIICSFGGILMIFACLAIGQLFQQHRIIAAIVSYIIFYILQEIIATVTMALLVIGNTDNLVAMEESTVNAGAFYSQTLWISAIESLLFAIVSFVICHYITKKKLNLE